MTTGTFYVNEQAACRGFYGTETKVANVVKLALPADKFWNITEAPNGTGLRLFSVSRDQWQLMRFVEVNDKHTKQMTTMELVPWAEFTGDQLRVGDTTFSNPGLPTDRVWLLTTFKNLDGHNSHWGTQKTYGSMFEEIVGLDGIAQVLAQTSTDELCISYFMCHRDNDIFNEMGDQPSYIMQTLIWNRRLQQFAGPSFPLCSYPAKEESDESDGGDVEKNDDESFDQVCWVQPPFPIQNPKMILSNMTSGWGTNNGPNYVLEADGSESDLKVYDLQPLLFTIFDGANLISYKLITPADEHVRQFRSRSHNKFAALFIAENKVAMEKSEHALEQLEVAKSRLFTTEELEMYKHNVLEGKIEFFNQLETKWSQWVTFDEAIYKHCDIQKNLAKASTMQEYQELVWGKLIRCNKPFNNGAVEAFWRMCCLAGK